MVDRRFRLEDTSVSLLSPPSTLFSSFTDGSFSLSQSLPPQSRILPRRSRMFVVPSLLSSPLSLSHPSLATLNQPIHPSFHLPSIRFQVSSASKSSSPAPKSLDSTVFARSTTTASLLGSRGGGAVLSMLGRRRRCCWRWSAKRGERWRDWVGNDEGDSGKGRKGRFRFRLLYLLYEKD